jgi:hypothetical protein
VAVQLGELLMQSFDVFSMRRDILAAAGFQTPVFGFKVLRLSHQSCVFFLEGFVHVWLAPG